jgi:hypothetical protein
VGDGGATVLLSVALAGPSSKRFALLSSLPSDARPFAESFSFRDPFYCASCVSGVAACSPSHLAKLSLSLARSLMMHGDRDKRNRRVASCWGSTTVDTLVPCGLL